MPVTKHRIGSIIMRPSPSTYNSAERHWTQELTASIGAGGHQQ